MYLTFQLSLIMGVLGCLIHPVFSEETDEYSHAVKMLYLRYGATLRWDTSSWSESAALGYQWPEWEKNPPKVFPKFSNVSVERQFIDQPFFEYIASLKHLKSLRFWDCQFSQDLDFQNWVWPPVKFITFRNEKVVPKIPDALWKSMGKSSIESVDYNIQSLKILKFVMKIPQVKRIQIDAHEEKLLKNLHPLKDQLTYLELKVSDKISPESFRYLKDFNHLQTLRIEGPITVEHLKILTDLPITNLALTKTNLRDSDLEIFHSWKSIRILYIPIETPYPHNNQNLTKKPLSDLLQLPEKTIDYRGSFVPF